MPPLYELAVMGNPSAAQIRELQLHIAQIIEPFGFCLGEEVSWSLRPTDFAPAPQRPAAVVFFGAPGVSPAGVDRILQSGIPVLPVTSAATRVHLELPEQLTSFNCLNYAEAGPKRISSALLECVGLLPRQRRVFVSYRRDSASAAALQLFNALSARLFDVFLDTHGIAPGEDFQAMLWHRLCDSDVLIMLDTQGYFDSRWTRAEYGRAMAKNISVLRIGWPDVDVSRHASNASRIDLTPVDVDVATGQLTDVTIARIADHLECLRGQSQAVRNLNLFGKIQQALEFINCTVHGVGPHNAVHATLPNGTDIIAYPAVGVPTSVTLQDAVNCAAGRSVAIVYDHCGLHPQWLDHLKWLGTNIRTARWVKASEAVWDLTGWEVQ